MKKANTKIFLTIIFLFIIILAFLYYNPIVKSENNNNKQCVLYKAISTNYTYQNLDTKKHVARFKILQNKDNLYVEFHPNFVITQPGEIKNYWIEAKTNKKINESEITYLIEVNNYPLQTIKAKLYFECEKYQTIQNNNTNNTNTTNQTNNNNIEEYKKSLLSMLFGSIKKIVITLIIVLIILIILLYYIVKIGRQQETKKTKTTKENVKKQKLEKMLEARVKVKKGLTTFQKIIIVLFIILLIILAVIAIKTMHFNTTTFTAPITTNITNLS